MCQIFASQDPRSYACMTRSIRLGGHCTSIRLEARFWDILDDIARAHGLTTPRFVSTLHDEVLELHGDVGNLASLLRCACVTYLLQSSAAAPSRSPPALPVGMRDVVAG